ncbi:GH92 family glycosyl hydrolase [Limnovirga soli]|uniref:Glycoside hydrolase family 92 protein n=1 Tax=Limnovirga soli TaxID=2656915 RepID=A0A8J8JWE5_9BACT|nr:GH92 family glycosyl hydrolase [Limnovirga soli]NNV55221.1 glycoside hydrolase family 92 protein [Limnovirga soli]
MKKILLLLLLPVSLPALAQQLTDFVNPFIGTAAHGHTYPGATMPFGMVQLSPDNGTQEWDWCSGYHYSDSVIQGFSHTHLSGTGIGDLCDISVLPMVNKQPIAGKILSPFSHTTEQAKPGYYSVVLEDSKIKAELTASDYCGFHRYTFPEASNAIIRFDLGFAINWDAPNECFFKRINDSTFVGYRYSTGWAKDQRVYFAVRTSKPVKTVASFEGANRTARDSVKNKTVVACLLFDTKANEAIEMKVALSFANIQGAMEALQKTGNMYFDEARKAANAAWEKELAKVKIKTSDAAARTIFYTALYHSFLAPNQFNDVLGNYKGVKGALLHSNTPVYSVSSLWDVFRAENPLFTLLQPQRVTDMVNSYLAFYDQSGLLPVWDLHFNETNTMTGYHAIPIIADALLKGFKGIDSIKAFEAMKKSAMQNIRGTNFYRQYGYVPQDKYGSSVTVTLEYAYDDWCIAQVAKRLKKDEDYSYFMQRAGSWRNLFDSTLGFARGKNSDGKWVEPFDPYYSEYDGDKSMYTEGNAWQHSWFVPQDVYGLINRFGSNQTFIQKLDELFSVSTKLTGDHVPVDISGLVGQYAHGNEPSHHIAYLYNYAGMPSKTAERVNYINRNLYTAQPDGLCGNEDCGQMSAWYVWSALGFYPVNTASGQYVIGTPMMSEATIQLPNNKLFKVSAKNVSATNIYIQSAMLNGKPYTKSFINHQDILKGGSLVFVMGNQPSKTWGIKPADYPGK